MFSLFMEISANWLLLYIHALPHAIHDVFSFCKGNYNKVIDVMHLCLTATLLHTCFHYVWFFCKEIFANLWLLYFCILLSLTLSTSEAHVSGPAKSVLMFKYQNLYCRTGNISCASGAHVGNSISGCWIWISTNAFNLELTWLQGLHYPFGSW
jgi:hypothetical protein